MKQTLNAAAIAGAVLAALPAWAQTSMSPSSPPAGTAPSVAAPAQPSAPMSATGTYSPTAPAPSTMSTAAPGMAPVSWIGEVREGPPGLVLCDEQGRPVQLEGYEHRW